MNTLILMKGALAVHAKGYWYTSGGEKSSFGYYPHLKQLKRDKPVPVFPDTQIHGDLRMAALWLSNQEGTNFTEDFVKKVFGKKGSGSASLFSITDLELDKPSREKWAPALFTLRARSEIEDKTRTNKRHMLAFLELSYLDGLVLHASFFMGYFKDESEADRAVDLLNSTVELLSGFGANRSRGYGRGTFEIKDIETISISASPLYNPLKNHTFRYTITPLVNFRNRPVNPARTQLLQSEKEITEKQMKAWFSNAFHDLYGNWPSPSQMSSLRFSYFYPALETLPGYPPPLSTLRFADGSIKDCYGQEQTEDDSNQQENLIRSKAKPLGEGIFLTNEYNPRAFRLKCGKRIRNSMTPNFVTLESGGLFVQEFIEHGQPFCGTVTLVNDDSNFQARVVFLLEKVYPKINGAFFRPMLEPITPKTMTHEVPSEPPFFLTEPLEYSSERMKKGLQVKLASARGYNTTLRRPRRNRLVFSPGSLVSQSMGDRTMIWHGLENQVVTDFLKGEPFPVVASTDLPRPDKAMKNMTRAQAGSLRRFLEMAPDLARNRIKGLLDKYEKWNKTSPGTHLIPQEYLRSAEQLLDSGKTEEFRAYIKGILEQYAVVAWQKKSKGFAENPPKGETHGDTQ